METWNKLLFAFKKEEQDAAVTAWVGRLKSYGFTSVDDLDLAIARVIERGYLADTGFVEEVDKADAARRSKDKADEFGAMWDRFHGTFVDDQDDFILKFHATARSSAEYIGPGDLNSTVVVLRELGRDDLADDLIAHYIDARKGEPKIFDLSEHPFGGNVNDPKLRVKFDAIHARMVRPPTLTESLLFMANTSSYNPEHLEAMRKASVDEYERLFLASQGNELTKVIKWSIRWTEGDNAEIGRKARQALERIKASGPVNALRVGKFGV